MVDKLRQFADKMILIKRHESACLDKKSTDILQKTNKQKTMKRCYTYLVKGRPAPNSQMRTKSEHSHSK